MATFMYTALIDSPSSLNMSRFGYGMQIFKCEGIKLANVLRFLSWETTQATLFLWMFGKMIKTDVIGFCDMTK